MYACIEWREVREKSCGRCIERTHAVGSAARYLRAIDMVQQMCDSQQDVGARVGTRAAKSMHRVYDAASLARLC